MARTIRGMQRASASAPPGIARDDMEPAPPDDDDGAILIIRLTPHARHACPIDLRITSPAAGSCIAAHLDAWERIAERRGFAVAPQDRSCIGLFLEPAALSVDDPLTLCRAVAVGKVIGALSCGCDCPRAGKAMLPSMRAHRSPYPHATRSMHACAVTRSSMGASGMPWRYGRLEQNSHIPWTAIPNAHGRSDSVTQCALQCALH